MGKIQNFTDLNVWREEHKLVLMVYKKTRVFPKEEIYSLIDQLRRAAISITSNKAEGFGRKGYKEKNQFYYQASSSRDIGYLDEKNYKQFEEQAEIVSKLLFGIIKSSKDYLSFQKWI